MYRKQKLKIIPLDGKPVRATLRLTGFPPVTFSLCTTNPLTQRSTTKTRKSKCAYLYSMFLHYIKDRFFRPYHLKFTYKTLKLSLKISKSLDPN